MPRRAPKNETSASTKAFRSTMNPPRVLNSVRLTLACWVFCASMVTTLTHAHAGGDLAHAHAHAGGTDELGPCVSHPHIFFFGVEVGVAPDQPGDGQSAPSSPQEVVEPGIATGLRSSAGNADESSPAAGKAPAPISHDFKPSVENTRQIADADRPTHLCARAAGCRSGVQQI